MLVWLATRMYLPIAWLDEVNRLGVAWPATRIPHAFELGKTTVLVACSKPTASVFAYFIPTGFTTVVKYSETQDFGKMMRLKQRHIVPMFIDDSDEDYLK